MSPLDRIALWGTAGPLLLWAVMAAAAGLAPRGTDPSLAQLLAAWCPLILVPLSAGMALLWIITRAITTLALPRNLPKDGFPKNGLPKDGPRQGTTPGRAPR